MSREWLITSSHYRILFKKNKKAMPVETLLGSLSSDLKAEKGLDHQLFVSANG